MIIVKLCFLHVSLFYHCEREHCVFMGLFVNNAGIENGPHANVVDWPHAGIEYLPHA